MAKELSTSPTLKDLQEHIKNICCERGWDKNSNFETFLLFAEEFGELAEAIREVEGLYTKGDDKEEARSELEGEMADVLNYLLDLANRFDVDLEKAYRDKFRKNEKRVW